MYIKYLTNLLVNNIELLIFMKKHTLFEGKISFSGLKFDSFSHGFVGSFDQKLVKNEAIIH